MTVVTVVTKNFVTIFFFFIFVVLKIVTKHKNLICDKTLKNSNYYKTQNTNCDKTQKLKL